ncbi:hypothetical protein FACS189487_00950 [Campylobacterota bacterium]|nr:hypothetical protein FACS189487_00950 [Campylobacterota bacterium]
MKTTLKTVLLIALISFFTGCGGGGGSSDPTPDPTVVTGVTLNKNSLTPDVAETETLIATISPATAINKAVTWSSSDETIATVGADGLVTMVAAGTATITVTTADGGKTATCVVADPDTAADNTEDFGAGASITAYNISNATDLAAATAKITTKSGNFVLNITGPITVGNAEADIQPAANTVISLRGGGTIHKSADTDYYLFYLNAAGSKKLILRDVTLKGHSGNSITLVYVDNGAVFDMRDGAITGNTASNGGGVFVNGGSFTMHNGTISGNTASGVGGGVYVQSGSFTMNGGIISGNTAANDGGGVFVHKGNGSIFNKTGGTIYGKDESSGDKNSAPDTKGHAVYVFVDGAQDKYRDKTLDNTAGGKIDTDNPSGWNE